MLISHEMRINKLLTENKKLSSNYDKIISDNLVVPGYIGASCTFRNLSEYIQNNINEIQKIKKEKIDVCENKNNELEKELKSKIEEIEQLKQKVNELILFKQDITLKFKISDENVKDEISINTKGGTKMSDVLSMLYGLCPYVKNLDIKGLCLEGNENEKIDEMKSVNENKLVNGSLIVLIV